MSDFAKGNSRANELSMATRETEKSLSCLFLFCYFSVRICCRHLFAAFGFFLFCLLCVAFQSAKLASDHDAEGSRTE